MRIVGRRSFMRSQLFRAVQAAKRASRSRALPGGIALSSGASSGPFVRPVSARRSGLYSAAPVRPVAAFTAFTMARRSLSLLGSGRGRRGKVARAGAAHHLLIVGVERRQISEHDLRPALRVFRQHDVVHDRLDEGLLRDLGNLSRHHRREPPRAASRVSLLTHSFCHIVSC